MRGNGGDHVARPRIELPPDQPEVVKRLHALLAFDIAENNPPALHTVPAVLMAWDFARGIVRIAHGTQTELEGHIVYLRICDLQLTFGQMIQRAAGATAASNPDLNAMGEVMAGKRVAGPKLFDG